MHIVDFAGRFNEDIENVMLPTDLRNIALGGSFNYSTEKVALPIGLRSMVFGDHLD